eukprot:CAMPEP_0171609606 /NCGR_PEP_ID=MMETSP0990-20121206/9577_1 /TAXON_ID=483369 /ORGANISM="non described non described, Strain CCMP2098" /LENGTH=113 /DNA_ID=CAMNT_0012172903 /DNA_START=952 /DNA_END=1289 /DNA_ORIENTATION=+
MTPLMMNEKTDVWTKTARPPEFFLQQVGTDPPHIPPHPATVTQKHKQQPPHPPNDNIHNAGKQLKIAPTDSIAMTTTATTPAHFPSGVLKSLSGWVLLIPESPQHILFDIVLT